jgi:hypothetical protein
MKAQDMKLWLPSEVGTRARCEESLQDYEYQLRRGQAVRALEELRGALLCRTHEYRYRDGMHGVKAKVRSGLRTDAIQVRVDSAAEDYRAARAALVKLGGLLGCTEWQEFFPPLKAEDVRGRPSAVFGDEERQRGKGKKKKARLDSEEDARRKQVRAQSKLGASWIWRAEGKTGEPGDVVNSERKSNPWYCYPR